MSRTAGRISLLLIGTLVGLLLAELVARQVWTAPWYERLLSEQQESERHRYELNSQRLRDRDYPSPKPPGRSRVLVLGDSFTFGQGVKDVADIFPEILERRLNEADRFPGGVDVLNAGLPGLLTDSWLTAMTLVSPGFEPDVVLIVFFLRDGTKTSSIPDFFGRIRDEIAARNRESALYRNVFLYRLWRDRRDRAQVAEQYIGRFQLAYLGDETETSEWRNAQRNLLTIRDLARANQARVGFVVFPMLVDLNDDYPFRKICELLEEFGRANAMPVFSLLPTFMNRRDSGLWVSPLDQHPNEKAHALAAEALLPFVTGLLEAREPDDGG